MPSTTTVITPSSAEEAAAAIAADPDTTIVGGGTLVVPHHTLGMSIDRAMWLGRAGLDSISSATGTTTIGAMTTLADCAALGAPLGPCAANIGDREVKAQATIGGNICAPVPYGDLRGPLLALDAGVRSAGSDGESTQPAADFFADHDGRLVLEISFDDPAAGSFVALQRHHTMSLTPLAISVVRSSSGDVRVAATGAAPDARRLRSVEAALAGGASNADAAAVALEDADPYDDVLASGQYRRRVLPIVVERALDQLGE